jgi:hypothetical protein
LKQKTGLSGFENCHLPLKNRARSGRVVNQNWRKTMTVKELIEKLEELPQDKEVFYECAEWGLEPVLDVYERIHDTRIQDIVFLSNLPE